MTPEILTVVGTGIALGAAILPGLHALRRDVGNLRERMARLEGLFEGFTRGEQPTGTNRPA